MKNRLVLSSVFVFTFCVLMAFCFGIYKLEEIKNEGEELELDGDSFKLDVSSSSLNLEGNIDGEYWEIQSDSK